MGNDVSVATRRRKHVVFESPVIVPRSIKDLDDGGVYKGDIADDQFLKDFLRQNLDMEINENDTMKGDVVLYKMANDLDLNEENDDNQKSPTYRSSVTIHLVTPGVKYIENEITENTDVMVTDDSGVIVSDDSKMVGDDGIPGKNSDTVISRNELNLQDCPQCNGHLKEKEDSEDVETQVIEEYVECIVAENAKLHRENNIDEYIEKARRLALKANGISVNAYQYKEDNEIITDAEQRDANKPETVSCAVQTDLRDTVLQMDNNCMTSTSDNTNNEIPESVDLEAKVFSEILKKDEFQRQTSSEKKEKPKRKPSPILRLGVKFNDAWKNIKLKRSFSREEQPNSTPESPIEESETQNSSPTSENKRFRLKQKEQTPIKVNIIEANGISLEGATRKAHDICHEYACVVQENGVEVETAPCEMYVSESHSMKDNQTEINESFEIDSSLSCHTDPISDRSETDVIDNSPSFNPKFCETKPLYVGLIVKNSDEDCNLDGLNEQDSNISKPWLGLDVDNHENIPTEIKMETPVCQNGLYHSVDVTEMFTTEEESEQTEKTNGDLESADLENEEPKQNTSTTSPTKVKKKSSIWKYLLYRETPKKDKKKKTTGKELPLNQVKTEQNIDIPEDNSSTVPIGENDKETSTTTDFGNDSQNEGTEPEMEECWAEIDLNKDVDNGENESQLKNAQPDLKNQIAEIESNLNKVDNRFNMQLDYDDEKEENVFNEGDSIDSIGGETKNEPERLQSAEISMEQLQSSETTGIDNIEHVSTPFVSESNPECSEKEPTILEAEVMDLINEKMLTANTKQIVLNACDDAVLCDTVLHENNKDLNVHGNHDLQSEEAILNIENSESSEKLLSVEPQTTESKADENPKDVAESPTRRKKKKRTNSLSAKLSDFFGVGELRRRSSTNSSSKSDKSPKEEKNVWVNEKRNHSRKASGSSNIENETVILEAEAEPSIEAEVTMRSAAQHEGEQSCGRPDAAKPKQTKPKFKATNIVKKRKQLSSKKNDSSKSIGSRLKSLIGSPVQSTNRRSLFEDDIHVEVGEGLDIISLSEDEDEKERKTAGKGEKSETSVTKETVASENVNSNEHNNATDSKESEVSEPLKVHSHEDTNVTLETKNVNTEISEIPGSPEIRSDLEEMKVEKVIPDIRSECMNSSEETVKSENTAQSKNSPIEVLKDRSSSDILCYSEGGIVQEDVIPPTSEFMLQGNIGVCVSTEKCGEVQIDLATPNEIDIQTDSDKSDTIQTDCDSAPKDLKPNDEKAQEILTDNKLDLTPETACTLPEDSSEFTLPENTTNVIFPENCSSVDKDETMMDKETVNDNINKDENVEAHYDTIKDETCIVAENCTNVESTPHLNATDTVVNKLDDKVINHTVYGKGTSGNTVTDNNENGYLQDNSHQTLQLQDMGAKKNKGSICDNTQSVEETQNVNENLNTEEGPSSPCQSCQNAQFICSNHFTVEATIENQNVTNDGATSNGYKTVKLAAAECTEESPPCKDSCFDNGRFLTVENPNYCDTCQNSLPEDNAGIHSPSDDASNEPEKRTMTLPFNKSHSTSEDTRHEHLTKNRSLSMEELTIHSSHIYEEIENRRPIIYRRLSDKSNNRKVICTSPDTETPKCKKVKKKKSRSSSFSEFLKNPTKYKMPTWKSKKSKDSSKGKDGDRIIQASSSASILYM